MEGVNQSIDPFIPFPLSHAPPNSRSLDPCFFPPFGGDGSSGTEGGTQHLFLFYRAGQAVRAASHFTTHLFYGT